MGHRACDYEGQGRQPEDLRHRRGDPDWLGLPADLPAVLRGLRGRVATTPRVTRSTAGGTCNTFRPSVYIRCLPLSPCLLRRRACGVGYESKLLPEPKPV